MQSSLDPADPALADDPRVRAYVAATRAAGIDETVLRDGLPVMGWNLAALTAAVLQRAPALERGPVMETAYHLDIGGRSGGGTPPGLLLDGIRIHTAGRADPWPIEGGRLVRRSGEGWEELVAVRDYDGRSPLGSGG